MKVAIILFNLGGPDSLESVQPFLRNLFGDPAILRLPTLIRSPLARFLSSRRTAKARAIYAKIGGSSPILGQTEAQARALEEALGKDDDQGHDWRGYVCMRYWHPMTEAVVRSVERFAPDRIVLLPLYPQFSTTTTASPRILRRTCRRCMPIDRTSPISLVRSSTESARVLITPTMAMMIDSATRA